MRNALWDSKSIPSQVGSLYLFIFFDKKKNLPSNLTLINMVFHGKFDQNFLTASKFDSVYNLSLDTYCLVRSIKERLGIKTFIQMVFNS